MPKKSKFPITLKNEVDLLWAGLGVATALYGNKVAADKPDTGALIVLGGLVLALQPWKSDAFRSGTWWSTSGRRGKGGSLLRAMRS